LVTQQLATIVLFVSVFVHLSNGKLPPERLAVLGSFLTVFGYIGWAVGAHKFKHAKGTRKVKDWA
jgi:hypothetical protein